MNRLTLRMGGFGLYFFIALDIFAVCMTIYAIPQCIQMAVHYNFIGLGGIVLIWGSIYTTTFIISQKISLTDESLYLRTLSVASQIIPRVIKIKVYNNDIDSIYLGSHNFIYKNLRDSKYYRQQIRKYIKQYDQPKGSIVPDLLAVKTKDEQIYFISTKPFSRKGFRKLFEEFHNMGLKTVQEYEL